MKNQNKKTSIIIVIAVGIISIIGMFMFAQNREGGKGLFGEREKGTAETPANPDALTTVEGGTRKIIQTNIQTPEPNEAAPSADVAVPKGVSVIGEKKQIALRTFGMRGENGAFSPRTLVVNDLDVIEIEFTAVDADYDIFFPDFGVLKKIGAGSTAMLQFQAPDFGEYEFGCKELCKGKGKLIVNKRQ